MVALTQQGCDQPIGAAFRQRRPELPLDGKVPVRWRQRERSYREKTRHVKQDPRRGETRPSQ